MPTGAKRGAKATKNDAPANTLLKRSPVAALIEQATVAVRKVFQKHSLSIDQRSRSISEKNSSRWGDL